MRSTLPFAASLAVIAVSYACSSGGSSGSAEDGGTSTSSSGSASSASSGASGSSGGATGGIDLSTFESRFCKAFSPCCAKYPGWTVAEAACANNVEYHTLGDPSSLGDTKGLTFDGVKAEACVVAMEAAVQAETYCARARLATPCSDVWKRGPGASPGSACKDRYDCAASPDGPVSCAGSSGSGVCQAKVAGKLGDACDGEAASPQDNVSGLSGEPIDPSRLLLCYFGDGLYCDDTTRKCTARLGSGAPCSWHTDCVDGLICANAGDGYKCQAARLKDQSCDALYLRCAEALYCESGTKTCVDAKPPGATCTGNDECGAASCQSGTCVPSPGDPTYYILYCGQTR